MKRKMMGLSLLAMLAGSALSVSSQEPAPGATTSPALPRTAALQADRQDMEERFRRLNSAIEELLAAEVQQRKRIGEIVDEVYRLREEVVRANQAVASCASVEDVKRLAKAIEEIEKKREQDKELIKDRFEELKKLYKSPPLMPEIHPPSNEASTPEKRVEKPAAEMKGYEYEVKSGDSLSIIVQAYRKQGVKVTMDQVIKANPGLNPNRLITGKKIFIPDSTLK